MSYLGCYCVVAQPHDLTHACLCRIHWSLYFRLGNNLLNSTCNQQTPSELIDSETCPLRSQEYQVHLPQTWTMTDSQMETSNLQPPPRWKATQAPRPPLAEGRWSWGTGGGGSRPRSSGCQIWTRPTPGGPTSSRWEGHGGCPKAPRGPCWPAACQRTAPWRGWTPSETSTRPREVAGTS